MITKHNGCRDNNDLIGKIGNPIDFLSDMQSDCITGDAVCLDLGLEACDKTSSCEGFGIYSGVHPNLLSSVNVYSSAAFNESNPCPGRYGLNTNLMWNTYKKISYGKSTAVKNMQKISFPFNLNSSFFILLSIK